MSLVRIPLDHQERFPLKTCRIALGRLIQVRIIGHMDFWLEVLLFVLTPSLNEES